MQLGKNLSVSEMVMVPQVDFWMLPQHTQGQLLNLP